MVTAIHSYKGKIDEHELTFDYGDKLKIIKIVAKVMIVLNYSGYTQ